MTKAVVTSLIWTGINCLLLYTVFYLDHRNPDSIPYLLLSIPVGLINCASIINSFYRLRKFDRIQLIYSIFGILNGFIFLYVLNQLHSLSGAMTN
jgi:hypothetical protein